MEKIQMNDINDMIRIAKKYYELGLSQEQIAQEEEVSKSSVSRLLNKAASLGYVKHEIIYPVQSVALQEQLLRKYFDIERIFILPRLIDHIDIRVSDTCRMLSADLNKIVSDNDIISVSWGRTMERLAEMLVPPMIPKKDIKIVQLNGSIATSVLSTRTAGILEKFMEAYSGVGYMLAAPVLVDDELIVRAITRDSRIKKVMDMARAANIAVFSIGQISEQSVLIERGVIGADDVKILSDAGAVGDICTRYFDINGALVDNEFNARTIGIELEELKKKKHRIGIAVGRSKADAIIGALKGGYVTSLYTDEITVGTVLKRCEELGY